MNEEIKNIDLIEKIEDANVKITDINNLIELLLLYFEDNLNINDEFSYRDYVVNQPKYRSLLDLISKELKIIELEQRKLVNDYYKQYK